MSFHLIPQALANYTPGANWDSRNQCGQDGVATIRGIQCLIGNILAPLPGLIALAAVAMMIWAGIRMMGAGSAEKEYAAAWATFTYAAVGLVLLSVVWFALVLIEQFTGAPVTQFGIN